MLECKCIKNLIGFAASRPPFVIFTLCLAIFAAGLFSIGYYVQSYGYEGAEMSVSFFFENLRPYRQLYVF